MTAVPGLTVVFPAHRHDVGQLLEAATLDWDYPVVFFEHKLLYGASQEQGSYEVVPAAPSDPGTALFPTLVRPASDPDLSIVTYGGMLPLVEEVSARLAAEDLSVEIVVPSLLQPMPKRTLLERLEGRTAVAIVEESPLGPGFGSELAATLLEHGFRGRAKRFAPPPIPIPAARSLESAALPDARQLFEQLAAFVLDAPAVFLHDGREAHFRPLVGGEALVARPALAAAPDEVPVFRHPRFDDLRLEVAAEGALHGGRRPGA